MQNISLQSSGMLRKQNFEILGLKVTQQSWLLLSLSLLPSFFAFLVSFFSLAVHLVGFILVGRVFRKGFRIRWKERWAMEQDFHSFFSGVLDWIVLILVWFVRSLHSAQVSRQSWPWLLKLMTSRVLERTWICMGSYGRFRGKWVNTVNNKECGGGQRSVVWVKCGQPRLHHLHVLSTAFLWRHSLY